METNKSFICGWCNQQAIIIWVHGHGQCSVCGYNIDECCRGENEQSAFTQLKKEDTEKSDDD
ncbi:MAG: hypothetical protein LDL01_02485 [Ignavibacterium sp.]|jgi:hypothetical protein|uniref:Uncharacterized protein n=1 Tax=Ignavibacterium album TaxID=591197 RepID=A0A7V2ZMA6_9BACT|nr:hypothetical protein [Ignavibacterium album]MCA2004639.1 hypothetical protein [Ignavibacterium sp.]MCX8106374.1 hypothetical protein [Ignavibacterium album]